MKNEAALQFKIASEDWEFEAIHRLNYKTFVEEIPQHEQNPEGRLVDKFHAENTYAICLHEGELVGMVAGRGQRPFSLDKKLPELDRHLPPNRRVMEVRLLSVEKAFRNGFVFSRLTGLMAQHFRDQGYDLAIISGTVRQLRLYKHLGFVPFGPLVGPADAQFQPMYLTLETFTQVAKSLSPASPATERIMASYLPGPVEVHAEVRQAFERGPVSHRSAAFMADFQNTQQRLCAMTGARHVEILVGSGSLANDAICAQLTLLREPGLVLSNGEFGERLIDHATRQGLEFRVHQADWGAPFDYAAVRREVQRHPELKWLWATHCETSTGILNDLAALQTLARERRLKLCLDCISAIGTVPVNLAQVYLASCVSGKALASYPGLSMVFYNHDLPPASPTLPRYLDLGYYAAQAGVPFTHSSNLLYALQTALKRIDWPRKYAQIAAAAVWLRERLRALNFQILADAPHASPAVLTIVLPRDISSKAVGWQLRKEGYLLSYNSGYLRQRNWIQVCLMGEWRQDHLERLPALMRDLCSQRRLHKEPASLQVA